MYIILSRRGSLKVRSCQCCWRPLQELYTPSVGSLCTERLRAQRAARPFGSPQTRRPFNSAQGMVGLTRRLLTPGWCIKIGSVQGKLNMLQVRCVYANTNGHGRIPVALNGQLQQSCSQTQIYYRTTRPTKDFFKVLRQLYTDHILDIEEFEDCYDIVSNRLRSSINELECRKMISIEITHAGRAACSF